MLNDPYATSQIWQVPVALGRPGDDKSSHVELVGDAPKTLTFEGCDRPIKANYGDVGYYRVRYDENGLKALGTAFHELAAADRVSLIADAWAMVLAGLDAPAAYLDLTRRLSNETELGGLGQRHREPAIHRRSTCRFAPAGGFRAYARTLLWTAFSRLGWLPQPGDETEATLLRQRLIAELGALGDPEVTAEARRRFAVLVRDRAAVPAALREPIAKAVAYSADQQIYEDLLRLAREQESEQERMIYYRALAGARRRGTDRADSADRAPRPETAAGSDTSIS